MSRCNPSQTPVPTRTRPSRVRRHAIVLALIFVAGAALRYWGLGFGLPHTDARPDESRIINVAVRIANGDLNPHYFVYPTLYMYLLAAVFRLQALVAGLQDVALLPRTDLFWTARCLTAAFGSATVLIVYALGKRLRDRLTGLLAAGFVAFAFLHVRDSHFATTDVPMAFGIVLALFLLLAPESSWRSLMAAGLVAGLATSLKYNALLIAPVAVFLEACGVWARRRTWRVGVRRLALFAALMVAGFLVGTPFAALDRPTFLAGIGFVAEHLDAGHVHDGQVHAVSNAAWRYVSFILPTAVGGPVYLLSIVGAAALLRSSLERGVAFLLFPVLYCLTASAGATVFARYMIPVVPFLCIGASSFICTIVEPLRQRRTASAISAAMAVVAVLPSAINAVRLDMLLSTRDNRLLVADWIEGNRSAATSIWQSGSFYGRIQYSAPGRLIEWTYDEDTRAFTRDGQPVQGSPDYILIQRSPLALYSSVPQSIIQLVNSEYTRLLSFETGLVFLQQNAYDASDAFFLPLVHLDAVSRPGPEFDLYQRRDDQTGRPMFRSSGIGSARD